MMSYARFGWDGSDVYVYLDVGGYFSCCSCRFRNDYGSFHADSTDEIVAHLREHEARGDCVPADTFTELEADREENDRRLSKENVT